MIFSRRRKPAVLAQIGAATQGGRRPGALGRADLKALLGALGELEGARAVMISGAAAPKRGVALGLASAAAASGRRVALIECDLERPTLASELGLSPSPGLHEYLRERAGAAEILQPAVLAGPASAAATAPLVCIVAGEPSAAAAELLGTAAFRHAAAKLRAAYELLVIDAPAGDEEALEAAAAEAEQTLACLGAGESFSRSKIEVAGLIQRS